MKEYLKLTTQIFAGITTGACLIALVILAIWQICRLVVWVSPKCELAEYWYLEVDNGEDKNLGADFERAKGLANGRNIYPRQYCK